MKQQIFAVLTYRQLFMKTLMIGVKKVVYVAQA
ncbi:hypothetical protein RABR111495_18580 [Rahnella bruchi]